MKTHSITLAFLFMVWSSFNLQSCDNAPKGDNATITEEQEAAEGEGQTFVVDTAASKVRFIGYGVGKNHPGNFKLQSGTVSVSKNQVTGGSFVIDIRSMKVVCSRKS
jgi:hypothetical protein